jgi:hypothetical protein
VADKSVNTKESFEPKKNETSDNYFERVNKEALEAFEKGEFKGDELGKIAERNKEDFFGMVKDFFKNPIEGLKWFGTKLFGETFLKWSGEIKKSYETVEKAKDKVVEVAESSYKKAKKVLNDVPESIKGMTVIGGVYEAGEKVVDYLSNNPSKAREMPEGKKAQIEWWKEIFLAAGVKPESAEGKGFLSLVMDGSTWEEIGENLKEKATNEKGYQKLKSDVESGEFDKMQPFKGQKLGVAAEKVVERLDLIKDNVLKLVKNNPNVATMLSVYLGYNIGLKKNGFRVAADFGKILLKLAASPLILAKNHKIKTMIVVLGAVLVQDQTKWDETIVLRLKETRLPENYQDFEKYLDSNKELNAIKSSLAKSEKELNEALGIFKDPVLLDQNFDEILDTLTSPSKIAGGMVDFVGNSPEENMAIANRTGFYKVQSLISNNQTLKSKLGDDEFQNLNNSVEELGKDINKNPMIGLDFSKLEKINDKYGVVGEFKFEQYGNYIRYSEIDTENGGIVLASYNLGIRQDINEEERIKAARRFNVDENFTMEIFKQLDTGGKAPESTIRMYREMLGGLTNTLSDTSSIEGMNKEIAENVSAGKYPMVSDGRNFFIYYGENFYPITLGAGYDILKHMSGDVEAQEAAMSYGEGLALYTVVAGAGTLGSYGADFFYKLATGLDRRLLASKGNRIGWSLVKGAAYPVTTLVKSVEFGVEAVKNFRRGGLKELLTLGRSAEIRATRDVFKYKRLAKLASVQDSLASSAGKAGEALFGKGIEKVSARYNRLARVNNIKAVVHNAINIKGGLSKAESEALWNMLQELDPQFKLGLWDKMKLGAEYTDVDKIKPDNLKNLLKALETEEEIIKNALKATDNGLLAKYAKSSGSALGAGARSLSANTLRGLGKAGGKLMKNRYTAVFGAAALGTYGLSEYLGKDEDAVEGSKELVKETRESKENQKKQLAKAIVGMQGQFTEKFMSDEFKEKLAGMNDYEIDQEVGKMATWFEKAHNDLMMEIWKNYPNYEGGLSEIQKYINEEMKSAGVDGSLQTADTSKWYEMEERNGFYLMNGLMSISENEDGNIVLGWASRPNVTEKFTRLAWEAREGMLTSLGKDMTPLLGVDRSFERAGRFYVQGNNEAMAREMGEGVSKFGMDMLGFISLGGSKTVQGALQSKKAVKTVDQMSALATASARLGKTSEAATTAIIGAAALSVGASVFKDEIDTYKVITK